MSCISAHDPQLERLADAIAQRVGPQRFHVWFNNSTKLDLKNDGLEIAVPNDFISEWIGKNFTRPIQEAAHEVLGCSLSVKFNIVPQLFDVDPAAVEASDAQMVVPTRRKHGGNDSAVAKAIKIPTPVLRPGSMPTMYSGSVIRFLITSISVCRVPPFCR